MKRAKPVKKLLSSSELAARLQTTVSTLLAWYHTGKIPAEIAEGVVFRFDEAAVVEAMEYRMARIKEFYAAHQAELAAGSKRWKIPGPTQFRERTDVASAVRRNLEATQALSARRIRIPDVPNQSNWALWNRQRDGRY